MPRVVRRSRRLADGAAQEDLILASLGPLGRALQAGSIRQMRLVVDRPQTHHRQDQARPLGGPNVDRQELPADRLVAVQEERAVPRAVPVPAVPSAPPRSNRVG